MKNSPLMPLLFGALLIVLLSQFQCGDCADESCYYPLSVQFVSKADGTNLYDNGTYTFDSLKGYYLKNDSTAFAYPMYSLKSVPSQISFDLLENSVGYIFQFNALERDTLRAFYTTEDTKCCGRLVKFNYGIFRGDTVHMDRDGYLFLKK